MFFFTLKKVFFYLIVVLVLCGIIFADKFQKSKYAAIPTAISFLLALVMYISQSYVPSHLMDIPLTNLIDGVDRISISIKKSNIPLVIGETCSLEATIDPAYDYSGIMVKWESNNPDIITVNENGIIDARASGGTTIFASVDYYGTIYKDSCQVNVEVPMVSLTPSLTLNVGDKYKLEYWSSAPAESVRWMSSAPEIATVDESGNVTAIAAGEADIFASIGIYNHIYDVQSIISVEKEPDPISPPISTEKIPTQQPTDFTAPADPVKEPESTLKIIGAQFTGDAVRGRVYVKFHITSNYALRDDIITIYPGEGEDPITVSYRISGADCYSSISSSNFAIAFPTIKSGETYTASMSANDISGNRIKEEIQFSVQ